MVDAHDAGTASVVRLVAGWTFGGTRNSGLENDCAKLEEYHLDQPLRSVVNHTGEQCVHGSGVHEIKVPLEVGGD